MFDMLQARRRRAPHEPGSILASILLHGAAFSLLTLGAGAVVLATEQVAEGIVFLAPPPTVAAGPEPEVRRLTFAQLPGAGGLEQLAGAGGFATLPEPGDGTAAGGRLSGDVAIPTLQHVADAFMYNADSIYLSSQVDNPVAYDAASAAPVYPDSLRLAGVEGRVEAQFVVDTLGRVEPGSFVLVESTHGQFTEAVVEALPDMLFRPALLNGRRSRQLVQLPFLFRIQQPAPVDTTGGAGA